MWGKAAAAAALAFAVPAFAQTDTYPVKPVRFMVGPAPGGATDIVARMLTQKMTEGLGQNVIIENRTGAAGSIAASLVAKSPADGYTILLVSSSYSINPSLYANLPFDPQKDLAPVTLLAQAPFLLVAHPSLPTKNVRELIALAKSKPGTLNYGSGGNGSSGHLAGALFENLAGLKLVHVPYKGAGPALVDTVAGQINFMFGNILSSAPYVKQQRLRALAVTSPRRSSTLPQLPTMAEAGVRDYSITSWYGLLAPAGTRPAVIERLSGAAKKSVSAPDLRERLLADGAEPEGSTPAEFQKHLASEIAKWRKVVKTAGVTSE